MVQRKRGRRYPLHALLTLVAMLLAALLAWLLVRRHEEGEHAAAQRELAELWSEDGRVRAAEPDTGFDDVDDAGPDGPDDLRQIDGVGPVLERTLHRLGITTFRQVATLTPDDVRRVGAEFGQFRDRIEREQWVEQARRLYEAKYGRPVEPAGSG